MGLQLIGSENVAVPKDKEGSFLKFYTLEGSGGRDYVRFPIWAVIERITITDPQQNDVDVTIENVRNTTLPPLTPNIITEISRLNTSASGHAVDALDFLCGSLGAYNDIFTGETYVRLRINFLPESAIISFRYYRHPHTV